MGIDIHAAWHGMTDEDKQAQIEARRKSSADMGHVGYLREAYHGKPFATHVLVRECFTAENNCSFIPFWASDLRERLPRAVFADLIREAEIHGNAKCRALLMEIGIEPKLDTFQYQADINEDPEFVQRQIAKIMEISSTTPEETDEYLGDTPKVFELDEISELIDELSPHLCSVKSLRDFVHLASQKERETGLPTMIMADY